MSDDFFDRVGSEVPEECPVCGLRRRPYIDGSSSFNFEKFGVLEFPNVVDCGLRDRGSDDFSDADDDKECPAVTEWARQRELDYENET